MSESDATVPTGIAALDPELRAWAEATVGGTITAGARTPSGGSRETWFVTIDRGDGAPTTVVLRVEAGGSFTGTHINVAREAAVYRALAPTPVPVPAVYGVAPGGAAVLLERLDGSDALPDDETLRTQTFEHFFDVIADLHRVEVDHLDLPGFDRPTTPAEHATLDLARWAQLGDDGVEHLDPLLRYAGAYLLAHPPSTVQRTCLVQGDTGPGNFVARDGRVSGLVDMEFAHIGDPMDDIAWVLYRFTTGRGSADLGPLLARYEARSGLHIDDDAVDYYGIAVQYRCAITTSLAVARGTGARGWAPYLLVTERYLQTLAGMLAARLGVQEPAVPIADLPPTPRDGWYAHLLEGIRAAVRAIPDEHAREQTRNQQILVHYLRAYDRYGATLDTLDRDDLARTCDTDPDDAKAVAALMTAAGAVADERVLRYLLRRAQRRRMLWASLLDRPRR